MTAWRKQAPEANEASALADLGRARRGRLPDGRELFRLPPELEERAKRIVRLGRAGLFGVVDGGADDDGPWFVRSSSTVTLDDDGARVLPLVLLRELATALAACEGEAIFPGEITPRAIGVDGDHAHVRGEALLRAWLGAASEHVVRDAVGRWDSPEVSAGGSADSASNRYALGLVVYRAIAKKHPFAGLGMRHAQRATELDPPPFDDAIAEALPPGLQSIVLGLLAPRPEDRPRSARAIVERLDALSAPSATNARGSRAPGARVTAPPASNAPIEVVPVLAAKAKNSSKSEGLPASPRRSLARPWVVVPAAIGLFAGALALGAPKAEVVAEKAPHAAPVKPLAKARASDCAPCHAREVAEWERSVMAHAAKSPLFGALESAIEEQNGRDARCPNGAGFLRKRGVDSCTDPTSGIVTTGSAGEHWCVRCHAPKETSQVPPWSAFGAPRGRAPLVDTLDEASLEGISCASCHETVGPVGVHGQASGYEGNPTWTSTKTGEVFLSRPEDREGRAGIANSGYRLDPGALLGDAIGAPAAVHRASSESAKSYRKTSEFCGSCHDVRLFGTDVVAKDRGEHFKRLRNGYSEWKTWADHETSLGRRAASCQDCHMSTFPGVCEKGAPKTEAEKSRACPEGMHLAPRAPGEYAIGLVAPGSARQERIFSHTFTSVDIPLTRSFPESFANERGVDARGVPLGLRARRDILLSRTFRFELLPGRRAGGTLEVPIVLENVGAGHRVPAGFSQEREVWVELRVEDAKGDVVYEVGKIGEPSEDLRDKRFVRVNVRDVVGQGGAGFGRFSFRTDEDPFGRPLGVFGADVIDGPDVPQWTPNPRFGGTTFRGKGLVNLQNGFLRCVKCIGFVDAGGKCKPGPGQGRTRADRYEDAPYDADTGECRSNLSGGEELFETYFPVGSLDADRGVLKAPDAIVDTRSAPPGVPITYTYLVETGRRPGPYRISAKLRFRSFPPFLVRAFAAYEAEHAARGERPSGPQVTNAMLDRIDVVDLAQVSSRIE